MDLDTGKVIDLLDSRDTDDVENALQKYPNIRIISRDRGLSYKALPKNYLHIADRFHLIMNLSDAISKDIKNELPPYIKMHHTEIIVKETIDTTKHSTKQIDFTVI